MADRRVNPQLPQGQVPAIVSQPVPLAQPALIDPATQRFDTSTLAKGLQHFTQKAAQRRSEKQEEANLQGREFARQNPEVFAAAADDESLERALKNAVKDGAVPRGLLPSFQKGIRQSVAEGRLEDARAKITEEVLRYSGIDENGEPKDLSQVQQEIAAISAGIIGDIPASLLTDPAFGERVQQTIDQLESTAQQSAFNQALSDRNDWAVKNAQEGFQGVLDEVEGPLSPEEQEGLGAVLDSLVVKFKNRGVEDVEVALVDAAINHAKRLRQDSVDDALHFIEEVGKFKIQGQEIGLDANLTAFQVGLEEEFQKAEAREVIRNDRDLRRVRDLLIEADADAVSLRESGDFDGYEAALRAGISEFPVGPEIDGRVELAIQRQVEIAKNEEQDEDPDMLRLLSLMENGQANVPDDWVEVYGGQLGPELFNRMATAYANQDRVKESREVNNRKVDRAVAAAKDVVLTSGLGLSAKSRFNGRMADFEESLREQIDERRAHLASQGLSIQEIDAEMESFIDGSITAFQTNADKVAQEIRNLDRQRAEVFTLSNTPTSTGLGEAQTILDELQSDFPPEVIDRAQRQILQAQEQVRQTTELIVADPSSPLYQEIENRLFALSDGEGDPESLKQVGALFEEIQGDFDTFVEQVVKKRGFFSPETAAAEVRSRVAGIFTGEEGVSLSEAVQREAAIKGFYSGLADTDQTHFGKIRFYAQNEDSISKTGEDVLVSIFRERSPSWSTDVSGDNISRLRALPDKEAGTILTAMRGTLANVVEGSIPLVNRDGEEVYRYDFDDLEIDWKITPLAGSVRGLVEQLNNIEIDDRGALMQQLGYLDQIDSEDSIRSATQAFIEDQTILIDALR